MKRSPHFLVLLLSLALSCTLFTGCVAVVAAGAAGSTVAYVKGALQVSLDGKVEHVARATTAALKDMKFALVSNRIDSVEGEIVARTALDVRIQILLKKQTANTTMVDIRVATFGDKVLSQQILEEIRKKL